MMEKINSKWSILLILGISGISLVWALSISYAAPFFQSPLPTPDWNQTEITPTPQPQPVILPNVTTGPATLTTGLRGHWQLNEADTGNRADSSPSGNIMTNVGGVSWAVGRISNASDFERGNTQYLKIESNQAVGLNFDYSFTLVGWIKREGLNNDMILVSKYAFGTGIEDRAYRFQLTSDNHLRLIVSPNGTYTSTYSIIGGASLTSTSTWYHVAAVFNADVPDMKLYLNGNLDAENTVNFSSVFDSTAPFMIGANLSDGAAIQSYDGLMDQWRVYTRALSQSEIQALMNE
jgi:hypothetical protein